MNATVMITLIGAVIYGAAFWLVEPLRCVATGGGCQTSGDVGAVLIVVPLSIVVVAVALAPYIAFVRWKNSSKAMSGGIVFFLSGAYGLLIPLAFFLVVGQLGSWISAFWLNTAIASACFAAYLLSSYRKLSTA